VRSSRKPSNPSLAAVPIPLSLPPNRRTQAGAAYSSSRCALSVSSTSARCADGHLRDASHQGGGGGPLSGELPGDGTQEEIMRFALLESGVRLGPLRRRHGAGLSEAGRDHSKRTDMRGRKNLSAILETLAIFRALMISSVSLQLSQGKGGTSVMRYVNPPNTAMIGALQDCLLSARPR